MIAVTPTPPSPPAPPSAPAPSDAVWEFIGDVEIGGERMALVERKDSKEGVYLRVGDTFNGGRVAASTRAA